MFYISGKAFITATTAITRTATRTTTAAATTKNLLPLTTAQGLCIVHISHFCTLKLPKSTSCLNPHDALHQDKRQYFKTVT